MERTLAIIKPDGVAKALAGEIILRIEKAGLKITGLKMVQLNKKSAEGFYAVHIKRPFFESLTGFMSEGPVIAMVLEADNAISKWRTLMGATNYKDAEEGTIRRDFATDIERNVVHGSDAEDTADFEINYFFNAFELCA